MGENPFLPERHFKTPDEQLLGSWELGKFKQVPLNYIPPKQSLSAPLSTPDLETNSDSEQDVIVNAVTPNSENLQDTLEQQKDFNYSQKLFHIADGNLYSIFSPIQGRSYGMKPSFLRKQKYTVQECHGRGRKNTRKGLKFHNFLPSESVTSEKDGGCADAKWKVYSECRLREEHGTKQISISNWSQSVPKTFNKNLACSNAASVPNADSLSPTESMLQLQNHSQDESKTKLDPSLNGTGEFLLNSFGMVQEQNTLQFNEISGRDVLQKSLSSHTSKKNSLNILLNSLSQKSSLQERITSCDELDLQNKNVQKHRRKPIQTRRIVPYKKYLSIVEENEGLPLDLSSKCQIEGASSQFSEFANNAYLFPQTFNSCLLQGGSSPLQYAENVNNVSNFISDVRRFSVTKNKEVNGATELKDVPSNQKQSNMAVCYPFAYDKNLHIEKKNSLFPPPPPLIGLNNSEMYDNTKQLAESRIPNDASQFLPSSQFHIQKSMVREVPPRPRRRNQRSVMKQKLEDTFRQNGFLVKTKQVSDGEATFCKFRQLRKCTRYYLKSLEQHLPDEFHKMLKGFLPPKTVLPPNLGTSNPASET